MRQVGDSGKSSDPPKPPYFLTSPCSRAVSRTEFADEYAVEWTIAMARSLPGTGVNMISKDSPSSPWVSPALDEDGAVQAAITFTKRSPAVDCMPPLVESK